MKTTTLRSTRRGKAVLLCCMGLVAQLAMNPIVTAQTALREPMPQIPPLMDREKEIALALSACPPSIADKASVYVLDKAGYVKVRKGKNGFTAIVQHALPISQDPQCMDAEGTRTFLPRYLKVAEMRAQGKSPEEIKAFVADAFAKGIFQPPTRVGIDYMLSTENITVVDPEKGIVAPFPPHVMFYGPYVTNADLGSDGNPHGLAFVAGEGTPHALIIVPVAATAHATVPVLTTGHSHDGGVKCTSTP